MSNLINFNQPTLYICALEAYGYSLCFAALSQNAAGEDIDSIGFNPNTGYTYIALGNGISICSSMGQSVEYLVTNSGEESFFDTYIEAEEFLETLETLND